MFAAIGAVFTLVFIALKVPGRIDWSWWVVFSPMIALGGLILVGYIGELYHSHMHGKQAKAIEAWTEAAKDGSPVNPFAALTEAFNKLGQEGEPPVA